MDAELKLKMMRWFFCGNPDVHAQRCQNGIYVPVYEPLTDSKIIAHMCGAVMLGAYPILRDGTVPWAAADFDDHSGGESTGRAFAEAKEFADTLRRLGVEPLCNTSRSGRGVHVRTVFSRMRGSRFHGRPVHAAVARRFMLDAFKYSELPSKDDGGSFDRVFPSQDTLKGRDRSPGNLIAMPLCKTAADEKCGTMLLDKDFNLVPLGESTWDFLSSYKLPGYAEIFDAAETMGEVHHIIECVSTENKFIDYPEAPRSMRPRSSTEKAEYHKEVDDLVLTVRACDFIQFAMKGNIQYELWFCLATILAQFDEVGGRGLFHKISSFNPGVDGKGHSRYDPIDTDRKYDEVLVKERPPVLCSTISSRGYACRWLGLNGSCMKHTREGRGARTPATIFYFVPSVHERARMQQYSGSRCDDNSGSGR